jgi:Uncharacterized protein predicted to be involved in DNA repair (RAMP superfamily)
MEKLKYQIQMLSDWHIGSGLDSATDADALVLKNDLNQPYIPGKTMKGLIKDAVQDMVDFGQAEEEALIRIFGKLEKQVNPKVKDSQISFSGTAYFSNAILPEADSVEINSNNLSGFLYRNISSTAIKENGVALDKSLRVTQVTTPVLLVGCISELNKEDYKLLTEAIALIRKLGVNRNRGLGRCKISVLKNEKS